MFGYFQGSTSSDATATEKAKDTATGVKDSVFSMFGGGAKKEKKPEAEDDADEPSGSSKAKKAADDAVGQYFFGMRLGHMKRSEAAVWI